MDLFLMKAGQEIRPDVLLVNLRFGRVEKRIQHSILPILFVLTLERDSTYAIAAAER